MKRSFISVLLVMLLLIASFPQPAAAKNKDVGTLALTEGTSSFLSLPTTEKVKKWTSKSPEIAAVTQDGEVIALSPGTAKVIAKTKKNKYFWTITVEAADFGSLSHEGYQLEQVVVLSRHDIRSPFSSSDSLLGRLTPHQWFNWSSNPSELSLRGGVLETNMGHYFRKWLEKEGLFPENYHPEEGEVRFYSNGKQRTIATSKYFSAGLLPTAFPTIEVKAPYDQMDPVFNPVTTYLTEDYKTAALKQMEEMYQEKTEELEQQYALLTDVIDLEESEAYKSGEFTGFVLDDVTFTLEKNKEPAVSGSLKTGCNVSDALVLQYYEESDPIAAAFGHNLSTEDWRDVSGPKDTYVDVLYTPELIAANIANPLLQEIESELSAEGREFTFLCGHDSNLASVMAALDVEEYAAPLSIETKTPIGNKMVFSRFKNAAGEQFWSVDLVYQTFNQLRAVPLLDLSEQPFVYHLAFEGMEQNADGLYTDEALKTRFKEAIQEYDELIAKYGEEPLEEAA